MPTTTMMQKSICQLCKIEIWHPPEMNAELCCQCEEMLDEIIKFYLETQPVFMGGNSSSITILIMGEDNGEEI